MVARTCKKIRVFIFFVVVSTLAASLTWIRPMEGEAAAQILARLQTLESKIQSLRVQMLAMQAQQTSTPETPPPEAAVPTQKGINQIAWQSSDRHTQRHSLADLALNGHLLPTGGQSRLR